MKQGCNKKGNFDELLIDFKRCSKHLKKSTCSKLDDSSHISKAFSHMMMKGQIRAAVRWITERTSKGGVLDASACIGSGSKTVLIVLKEKHPDPSQSSVDTFLPCNELPPLTQVDLTSCPIEKVARQIQGSAGPGGTNAGHWKDFLLHYGPHSAKLRDALAELARRLQLDF